MGPKSMGVALLTACFVGMVFTIQVGLSRAVRVLGPGHSATIKKAQTTGKLESSTSRLAHLQRWKRRAVMGGAREGPACGGAHGAAQALARGGHGELLHAVAGHE